MEKQGKRYPKRMNREREGRAFMEGDLVWVHLRKERRLEFKENSLQEGEDSRLYHVAKLNSSVQKQQHKMLQEHDYEEDGAMDNASSKDESSSISNSDASNEYSLNYEGDLLMVGENDESQRENIFHSPCHVVGQLCSIILDRGNSVKIASSRLLQWLKCEGELVITKQISLAFTLGKYEDEVLSDIVPKEETHILLGRPWQYDHKMTYNGVSK
ncbi:hypothetical protein CR513_27660, partial [Mucuna pruriens]